jgi:hypothetical protein
VSILTSALGGQLLPEDTKWDDVGAKYNRYGDFWDRHSPPYDTDLANFLQKLFAGMTGIASDLIRPRWQPEPPNQPPQGTNWMAFGIQLVKSDTYAAIWHKSKVYDVPGAKFDDGSRYSGDGDQATGDFDSGQNFDTQQPYDASIQQYDKPDATFDDGQTFDINAPALQADILYRNEELDVLCSFYGLSATRYASRLRDGWQIAQNREALQLAGAGFIAAGEMTTVPDLVNNIWVYRVDLPLSFRRAILRAYPVLDITSADAKSELITDISPLVRQISINPPSQ